MSRDHAPEPTAAPDLDQRAGAAGPGQHPGSPVGPAHSVLALQRQVGNAAVRAFLQRDDPPSVSVTGVSVSPAKSSVPIESGNTIKAKATPADATGVKWSLEAGGVAPAGGTAIDASTGVVTVSGAQPGGTLTAKATSDDGAWANATFQIVETPASIVSTSASASGTYAAEFVHTFMGAKTSAGLEGANVNEKFAATSVSTPFGPFSLNANKAGSHGWDLDSSGAMAGPDTVSIGSAGVNLGDFVANASTPNAKPLPASFAMTQNFHAKSFPSGTLSGSSFTSTQHIRRLQMTGTSPVMVIGSGSKEVEIDYAGPPAYRNAKADKATVQASVPKPAKGEWKRSEVQVSVETIPSGTPSFWISGKDHGCTVDSSGKVLIGSEEGTITVRAGDSAHKKYDEVTITITPAPAPPPTPAQGKKTDVDPLGDADEEAVPAAAY